MSTKREYVKTMQRRYQATRRRSERSQLLDELVDIAGYTRKHAITKMNQQQPQKTVRRKKRPGRPRSYQHCLATIELLWETLDYCCAQRLHPQLTPLAECLARHGEIRLTLEVKQELAQISRATLARRLNDMRRPIPKRILSGQHPSNRLKSLVPIDRYRWNEERPGALEIDLVSHGAGGKGHHAYTLSVVDIVSGWSHRHAVMGKSQAVVLEALEALLHTWPTAVWALHSDNGSEFLSAHLINYCEQESIEYHRSRPFKKNDNAHVEQRNRQFVREVVGYERIDTPAGVTWLNNIYTLLDPYANLFLPSLKIIEKTWQGNKAKKTYDTARTPHQRLREKNAINTAKARELDKQQQILNPLQLRRTLNHLQRQDPNQLPQAAD